MARLIEPVPRPSATRLDVVLGSLVGRADAGDAPLVPPFRTGLDPLDETLRGERLGARPFEVRRYRQWRDIEGCEILFISRSEGDQIGEIVTGLRNRPILTVSDTDDFARRGGMIQFVTDKGRIRLRINLEAAQAANLTISSKLLRVAEIVRSPKR